LQLFRWSVGICSEKPMSVLLFLLAWTVLSLPLGILVGKAIAVQEKHSSEEEALVRHILIDGAG
jgi:hypothetical protein